MKILVVNDDSVSAPGIALLAKVAAEFGEVWVVAPAEQCSAMSQKLTLRDPMTLERVSDFPAPVKEAWKLGGTPVDCVKVGLIHLLEEKPDWVLSGINNGYNAGFDIAYSGTLGAAFEAVRNGIPAMAFSIRSEAHLKNAEDCLRNLLKALLEKDPGRGNVWNVNIPGMKEGNPRGILYDRKVAPVSMYQEQYIKTVHADGTVTLLTHGIPTKDEEIPDGSDAAAVRNGYVSVGKVSCGML